jgi:plastocyanin
MTMRRFYHTGIALALAVGFPACGSSGGSTPTTPTPTTPGTGTVAATITIGANGVVSPRDVTVAVGSRVTFVNSHNATHEMTSDPHPDHGLCPPLNQVGNLAPGQSRTSGNLNTPGVCTYHDHLNDGNGNLHGTIRIQ